MLNGACIMRSTGELAWLADTGVLQALLDMLGSSSGGPARENAAIVLSAVARSNTCPLTHALGVAPAQLRPRHACISALTCHTWQLLWHDTDCDL